MIIPNPNFYVPAWSDALRPSAQPSIQVVDAAPSSEQISTGLLGPDGKPITRSPRRTRIGYLPKHVDD